MPDDFLLDAWRSAVSGVPERPHLDVASLSRAERVARRRRLVREFRGLSLVGLAAATTIHFYDGPSAPGAWAAALRGGIDLGLWIMSTGSAVGAAWPAVLAPPRDASVADGLRAHGEEAGAGARAWRLAFWVIALVTAFATFLSWGRTPAEWAVQQRLVIVATPWLLTAWLSASRLTASAAQARALADELRSLDE